MDSHIRNVRGHRRGVTLLLVVSIIVLFLLMGTTFVVLTNDYVSDTRVRMELKSQDLQPRETLMRGFLDILRGPALDNTHSPLRGHSLLADMYGYGITGYIDFIDRHPASAEGNLYEVRLRSGADSGSTDDSVTLMRTAAMQSLDTICGGNQFYFNGCVFSIVSGPGAGRSFRILEHRFDPVSGANEHTFTILEDHSDGGSIFDIDDTTNTPQDFESGLLGSRVVINGRAFSGTAATTSTQPNYRRFDDGGTDFSSNLTNYISADNSPNEPWDAVETDAIDNFWLSDYKLNDDLTPRIERASFHRPDLTGGPENTRSLRPVVGTGANATAILGQFPSAADPHTRSFAAQELDVDNLGDGENDSAWLDFGSPVTTLRDGRLVKALFAPLIIDLDRNVNINAAGVSVRGNQVPMLREISGSLDKPKGFGFGPPEFELDEVLSTTSATIISSRYGADGVPGVLGRETWSHVTMAGWPDNGALWNNQNGALNQGGLFGSSVDLYNRYSFGYLNSTSINNVPVGLPGLNINESQWDPDGDSNFDSDIIDSPYEMDLLHTSRQVNDDLYTAREMEAFLRILDPDAVNLLPNRLQMAVQADIGTMNNTNLNKITTHSFEVPRTPLSPNGTTVVEALQARITGGTTQTRRQLILTLLAPEVIMGLPMDINRPFGDGVDNNMNGIVDEHSISTTGASEAGADAVIRNATGYNELTPTTLDTTPMDHNNDGTANGAGDNLSRQIFARHLMILTWLTLADPGALYPDFNRDGTASAEDVHQLAQWCANVVDFRDSDSIMTGFEYDLTPFDGWDVDGDLSTDDGGNRFVVFGAERPELLINETFAAHIRRMDDLDSDPTGADTANGDDDYDNEFLPEPVCFVELLSPQFRPRLSAAGTDKSAAYPLGLYNTSGNLPLGARTGGNSPIWRMAFTEDMGDDPMNGRRVYFNQPSVAVEDGTNPNYYYPENSIVSSYRALAPGGRALVGSSGIKITSGANEQFRTTFGRRNDAIVDRTTPANSDLRLSHTRGITLEPGTGVYYNDGTVSSMTDAPSITFQPAVAIPINRWGPAGLERSFGLSDPDEGYEAALGVMTEEYDPDGMAGNGDGDGRIIVDAMGDPAPVDYADNTNPHAPIQNRDDGLYDERFRWVQLQRLANPLADFDPVTNPYITVDETFLDLIVFNGHDTYDSSEAGVNNTIPETELRAIERGHFEANPALGRAATERRLLWRPEMQRELPSSEDPGTNLAVLHHFNFEFFQTLGGVNLHDQDSDVATGANEFATRSITWPEFPWYNRPFVSQYELMNVPFSSGVNTTNFPNTLDPTYPMTRSANVYSAPLEMLQRFALRSRDGSTPGGHLLPFRNLDESGSSSLARLMDAVEVPSMFAGTHLYLDPTDFSGYAATNRDRLAFNPPYNRISRFRYPGKINLNTMQDEDVWDGLWGEVYRDITMFDDDTDMDMDALNQQRDNVPFAPITDNSGSSLLRTKDATMESLFQYVNEMDPALNTIRSPSVANLPYNRLANMTTTRSSVFAIWVTMAYFEVDADGKIGAEIGTDPTDLADQVRYRGFWIYDRSIPVAFEPGSNHNVDRGILVQSFFEE